MNQSTEVVIIGAGVIGCSIAYALRKQDVAVMVLDKGEVGAQASKAATGMLAPLKPFARTDDPYTRLLLSSLTLFPDLVVELEQASGICLEYEQTGSLRLMRPQHLARVQTWVAQWQQEGFPVVLLMGKEMLQYEPELASHFSLAVFNPQEPQLHASHLVQAYAQAAAIEYAWAGLLPKTPDARPILGFALGWENVILACGYNGYGLLLSALTGPLIAEQVITGQLPTPLQLFMKE